MLHRRLLLKSLAAVGIGTPVFHRALVALQEQEGDDSDRLSAELIKQAEWVSEIELSDEEREQVARQVDQTRRQNRLLREVDLDDTPPALHFQTLSSPPASVTIRRGLGPIESAVGELPESDEAIAFLPVTELSGFVRRRQLTSTRLTKIYLERLKKYSPMLRCVVNLTEERALEQAARADRELAAGVYRGPLHGIPWGAKDLIGVPGYPTSWGIPYLADQRVETQATVAERLEAAGAVLVAKLSLGALAMGDKWFGGLTRNPWDARIGSSGSSAGSASATVAGLVGFSLGSETLGSILSPSIRCGATGLRPTFGRVSRYGCMPLSWSMDKIGPICRSTEDCALVFAAIHGADGKDLTARDFDFQWPPHAEVAGMRIGYSPRGRQPVDEREDLQLLRELGCELVEMELPREIPLRALTPIIDVEGAAMFDQLLRAGHTDGWNTWTNTFRAAQFISGVDYVRYQRVRTKLMHLFEAFLAPVDAIVNMNDLVHTNFTGHPSVVFPRGYREQEGVFRPQSTVLTGHLNQDERILALAHACQSRLDAHLQRPPLDRWLADYEQGTLDPPPEEETKPAGEASQGAEKESGGGNGSGGRN